MSAFNDYCIVCDQLCTSNSAYCSESCKLAEQTTPINNTSGTLIQQQQQQQQQQTILDASPQTPSYLSPLLQATSSALTYDSPLLTSTTGNNFDLDSDCLNLSYETLTSPRKADGSYLSDILSSTSTNYKKWLHSTKATISN